MFPSEQPVLSARHVQRAEPSTVNCCQSPPANDKLMFFFDRCRCKGLIFLETYSSLDGDKLMSCLPKFLNIVKEVTGDPSFSMFNLSLKEDWSKTKKFCHSLHGKEQLKKPTGNERSCDGSLTSNGMA